jgi:hypothetical protein
MTLEEIRQQLNLTLLTESREMDRTEPTSGYASDLLSCVMVGARNGGLWVTLQAHSNVVAVASLLDLSAVIITEGAMPDSETLAKANQENVILFSTEQPTFSVVGRLWNLGLRNGR